MKLTRRPATELLRLNLCTCSEEIKKHQKSARDENSAPPNLQSSEFANSGRWRFAKFYGKASSVDHRQSQKIYLSCIVKITSRRVQHYA